MSEYSPAVFHFGVMGTGTGLRRAPCGGKRLLAPLGIPLAVGRDLEDAYALRGKRRDERLEVGPVLHVDMRDTVRRAEPGEVDRLGCREELLEDGVELGHREMLENTPALVVDEDDREAPPELGGDEEAV